MENWTETHDEHMARSDFARFFCQDKTHGLVCGKYTGGGKCQFHLHHKDTEKTTKIGKYSGYSPSFKFNKGSEKIDET